MLGAIIPSFAHEHNRRHRIDRSYPKGRIVGYRQVNMTTRIRHNVIEDPRNSRRTFTGTRLSNRIASSSTLPFGTIITAKEVIRRGKHTVVRKRSWIVLDRGPSKIELYVHRSEQRQFRKTLEGVKLITLTIPVRREVKV